MTKEEIVDIIKSNVELDDYGRHIYYNTMSNALWLEFEKEKRDLVKDFIEKVKENYSAHDKDLGVNVVFLTEKELDDCVKFFFEESK